MISEEPEMVGAAPSPPAAHAVDLVKTYGRGARTQWGHRRVRARAFHCGNGAVGIGKVHPDALYGRP